MHYSLGHFIHRQTIELEEKARLHRQLRVIRKQRERLKAVASKWEVAATVSSLMKDVDETIKNR